jgi:hypothetical protein
MIVVIIVFKLLNLQMDPAENVVMPRYEHMITNPDLIDFNTGKLKPLSQVLISHRNHSTILIAL